jgi:hypothetical protein
MVLPDRIELSTSPLPMECSTTELRQRAPIRESAKRPLQGAPILATRPGGAQAREGACEVVKNGHNESGRPDRRQFGPVAARSGSHFLAQRFDRTDHDLEFEHFASRQHQHGRRQPGIGDCIKGRAKHNILYSDRREASRPVFPLTLFRQRWMRTGRR